nr:integrase, catalytic region, zinc finger, CCHC-type, peptidase aspartic, catalytic [Tanacetum cinerariifolium]
MQTQTSNTLHNAIMEACSKDRSLMLAPGNYVQWKSRIKRYIDTKPNHELIHYCLTNPLYKLAWEEKEVLIFEGSPVTRTERFQETYKNVSQDIRDQLNAEAEAVQIILTGKDNDIYLTVDACPNAFLASTTTRMAKHQNEVNEIRAERIARTANPLALVAQQQPVYHPQTHPTHYTQNSLTKSQQAATRNRGKSIVNSPQPIYDQEPSMVTEDDETVVRTDNGTEFLNQTLHAYFAAEGILYQTSIARTPKQNGVVERRNRTLVEAAQTMLSAAKFLYSSGLKDGENLDKMKEKGDECIFVGSDPTPTCQKMASVQISFDPAPDCQTMALEHDSLSSNDIVVGLPKLKFIKDHLCSSCELGKSKRKSFHTKLTPSSKKRLHLLHMDLCGPMRVASINGKRYVC